MIMMRPSIAPLRGNRVERSGRAPRCRALRRQTLSGPAWDRTVSDIAALAYRAMRGTGFASSRHSFARATPLGKRLSVGYDDPAHRQRCQGPAGGAECCEQPRVLGSLSAGLGLRPAAPLEQPTIFRIVCAPANLGQASEQMDQPQDGHACWREGRHKPGV